MGVDEFDQLTPSDWSLLHQQWERKQQRDDLRSARICVAIYAVVGVQRSVNDFMSKRIKLIKPKTKKLVVMSSKAIEEAFVGMFPGSGLKPQWRPTQ